MTEQKKPTKLETAVNGVGKELGKLGRVIETDGHNIKLENVYKAFAFLHQALEALKQKSLLAHTAACATNGAFSLDMEMPTANPTQVVLAPVVNTGELARIKAEVIAGEPYHPRQEPALDDTDMDELEAAIARDSAHDDTPVPAAKGRRADGKRPVGRLVGTKEVFFDKPEVHKPDPVDPREMPDKHGYIAEAGFIEDN